MRAASTRPWLAKLIFARDPWGNFFDPDVVAQPYPVIAKMWEGGPVVYRKTYRRWFVLGYEECQYVGSHPTASVGAQMEDMFTDVRPYCRLAPDTKDFFRNWMLLRDGDHHQRLRNLVSQTFTPRRIAEFEPTVERAVADLLDDIESRANDGGPVDMVSAFNRPLPVNVISELLGIPSERAEWVGEIVAAMSTFLDPVSNFDVAAVDSACIDFRAYILELAHERLADPRDDLITALAQAEDDGDRLTEDELVANAGLLVFAGHDTTTHMLGNALVALAAHPEQLALVKADPSLWPNAVEELLRFDTTIASTSRLLSEDLTLGDVTIPAGSAVSLQLAAANRDPRRYDEPYELRLDRDTPRPLSFGHGIHHCLGHALARMELRLGLGAIVDRFGQFTVDPAQVDWRVSAVLRGPTRLVLMPERG